MKYIDADRLKAEINKRKKSLRAGICGEAFTRKQKNEMLVASEELDRFNRIIDSLQQKQHEIDLEKFTEKMEDWKARYNHPDNIPIKATMAFTARMFYMYPDVARQWYDNLPKVTQD